MSLNINKLHILYGMNIAFDLIPNHGWFGVMYLSRLLKLQLLSFAFDLIPGYGYLELCVCQG